MNIRRRFIERLTLAVVAVYTVISIMFVVVVLTPDTNLRGILGSAAFSGASAEQLAQIRTTYLEARGRDAPLIDRYINWLVDITLLRWGVSPTQKKPVIKIVGLAVWRTASYLIPGILMSSIIGTAVGLRSARKSGSVSERVGRIGTYMLLGLPSFWVATIIINLFGPPNLPFLILRGRAGLIWTVIAPSSVVALGLIANQVSLTRSASIDHFSSDYYHFLQAKGLSKREVTWRVFRNISVPVISILTTELFSVLVLTVVVVESVFRIRGIGWLTYIATQGNDIPLILGTTIVLVTVGAGGSLVCDIASAWLDPRSREAI